MNKKSGDKRNKKDRNLKDDFKVLVHFLKLTHRIKKSYIPLTVLSAVFGAITPFLSIIMPKFIIDELLGQKRSLYFFVYIIILILGNGILNILNKLLTNKIQLLNIEVVNGLELHLGKHIMNMDFENLEDPKILDMKEQAIFPINNQGAIWRMMDAILSMIRVGITLIGLATILSILNPIIIVLFIAMTIISRVLNKKAQKIEYDFTMKLIPLNRKFAYYGSLFSDFSMAKDIRIYNLAPYMSKKVYNYIDECVTYINKSMTRSAVYVGFNKIIIMFEMILLYGYMVLKVLEKSISIGDFSMYIASGTNFTDNMNAFTSNFIRFRQMCVYLDTYLKFEQLPKRNRLGKSEITDKKEIAIEFKHVYFKYPRSEEYVLKDINIKINKGEKLSVVGQNGAGKTTFIKLLCRLYEPEKGEILLNGKNINEYSYDEYMNLLAVVFQDYKLFSFTLKENIAFHNANKVRDEEIIEVLNKVSLNNKVDELEKGIHTSLYKNFDKQGTDLSGGQAQKLSIARALYKNSPIVILDEPTAALDPYAEYEIYTSFNQLIGNKMAIYISHRLSSCKFCDKIAVFDKGVLSEYGTHKELVDLGGKYSEMWNAQAMYYV